MNLSKIHHIAIIVSDYEAAKNFYVNKLGFSVIRENYRPELSLIHILIMPELMSCISTVAYIWTLMLS